MGENVVGKWVDTKAVTDTKKRYRYRYLDADTDTDTYTDTWPKCGDDDDDDGCSARWQVQGDTTYQGHNMAPVVMANEISTGSWPRFFSCMYADINGLPTIAHMN